MSEAAGSGPEHTDPARPGGTGQGGTERGGTGRGGIERGVPDGQAPEVGEFAELMGLTEEDVAALMGVTEEDIDALLAQRPSSATEEGLARVLDGVGRSAGAEDGGPGLPGSVSPVIERAEGTARRIVADAHRRAGEIIRAARRRASEHTERAVQDSVTTLVEAQHTAERLLPLPDAGRRDARPRGVGPQDTNSAPALALGRPGAAPAGFSPERDRLVRVWVTRLRDALGPLARDQAQLTDLAVGWLAALDVAAACVPCDRQAGEAVGRALVGEGLAQPRVLEDTVAVLTEGWILPAGAAEGVARAAVLGAVTAGFTEQLRCLIRDQQAAIQHALHSAAEQVALSLRGQGQRDGYAGIALFDPLTGLPNRVLFTERLDAADARPGLGRSLGVCALDIAGFKQVNDAFGPAVGDRVLARVARRLTGLLGEEHLVARLGSDEFAVLIEDCAGPAHLSEIADRVHRALGDPIAVESWRITLRAPHGLAQAPPGAAAGLLGHAEQALTDAENRDRPTAWYDLDTARAIDAGTRIVRASDFTAHYHPVLDLAGGTLHALSLDLRYRHPILQNLDPDQVVDLTGDGSWLPEVFGQILRRCCAHATSWPASTDGPLRLIVGLPGALIQAGSPRVVEQVRAALHHTGLPAEQLAIEIPERFATSHGAYVYSLASQLHADGVPIGISDFGTGFSNLGYLRSLPLRAVTFDPAVIQGLDTNDPDSSTREVLRAMVSIAGSLDLRTVAREVTSTRVRRRLLEFGVDYAHGPGVGGALTPEQITALGPAMAGATVDQDR